MTEYLTTAELAARLKLEPKTVSGMKTRGVFVQGVHYYYKPGVIGVRFDWGAVERWLKEGVEPEGGIPMARGYKTGG